MATFIETVLGDAAWLTVIVLLTLPAGVVRLKVRLAVASNMTTWVTSSTTSLISFCKIFNLETALYWLLTVTVIITSPALSGVTRPLLSTVAINGLEDDHLISLTSPLSGAIIGFSWTLWVRKTSDETISNVTELILTTKGTISTL